MRPTRCMTQSGIARDVHASTRTYDVRFHEEHVLIRHVSKSLSAFAVLATTIILGASAATAAGQNASNNADSAAANAAKTSQYGNQGQNANSSSGSNGCWEFCTGGGGNLTLQSQSLEQGALTQQWADSAALAKQNAVNA